MLTAFVVSFVIAFTGLSSEAKVEKIGQFVVASSNFVSWKSEKDFGALMVAVYNEDSLEKSLLSKPNLRTARGRRIEVKRFDWAGIADYNMIYVGNADAPTLKKLIKAATEHKIILVSESKLEGSPSFRIYEEDNKLRYDLEEAAFVSTGISLNPTLLRVTSRAEKK